MIMNKSAVERGLAHGSLFKCEALDLREDKGKAQVPGAPSRNPSRAAFKPCQNLHRHIRNFHALGRYGWPTWQFLPAVHRSEALVLERVCGTAAP